MKAQISLKERKSSYMSNNHCDVINEYVTSSKTT